ncbi:MAG: hypothetical protein M3168_02525, partial [Actinomycetota bacterium]|nr:hypothetical protein [Actinomycetota bacterium]
MASTQAALVDVGRFSDGVTATIPRSDFEAALASDEPAELFLEVTPREDEKRDVSVAWSRADLERLLEQATGPTITLAFDRSELERVLSADVEAHGFRERAAILAVAAVAAAGSASTAGAVPEVGGVTSGGITPSYVAIHDEATLAERGIVPVRASSHDEATLAARGIEPSPLPAVHDEATLA